LAATLTLTLLGDRDVVNFGVKVRLDHATQYQSSDDKADDRVFTIDEPQHYRRWIFQLVEITLRAPWAEACFFAYAD
jgi:hypothetical protein